MNSRFEIPIDSSAYNLFAIDDYLRSIRTREGRQKLIRSVGYSARLRAEYERRHGLPRGAVQLAMVTEDRRVQELSDKMSRKFVGAMEQKASPQEMKQLYLEVESLCTGLRTLYPEAVEFMKQYGMLSQRNKQTFYGDYQFGNEYRIMLANVCPGQPPEPWWHETVVAYVWSLAFFHVFVATEGGLLFFAFILVAAYLVWFAAVIKFVFF